MCKNFIDNISRSWYTKIGKKPIDNISRDRGDSPLDFYLIKNREKTY